MIVDGVAISIDISALGAVSSGLRTIIERAHTAAAAEGERRRERARRRREEDGHGGAGTAAVTALAFFPPSPPFSEPTVSEGTDGGMVGCVEPCKRFRFSAVRRR